MERKAGSAEEQRMKARYILLAATGALIFFTAPAYPHDVPNMEHTHAFQQTGYGKYRQGHYVNGAQGSIIIWSAKTYNSLQGGQPVKFARPSPIVRAPGSPVAKTRSQANSAITYGNR
jgi:hypothetical protein